MESYDDGVAGNKRGSRRQKFITLMDLLASMPKHSLKGGGIDAGKSKIPYSNIRNLRSSISFYVWSPFQR